MNTNEMIGLIVAALGTIVGTGAAIATPLIKNVKAMTELNISIKNLTEKFNKFEVNNHDDHKRIWLHNDKQDEVIQEHDRRILLLESEKKND
jgi:hypothetical protein